MSEPEPMLISDRIYAYYKGKIDDRINGFFNIPPTEEMGAEAYFSYISELRNYCTENRLTPIAGNLISDMYSSTKNIDNLMEKVKENDILIITERSILDTNIIAICKSKKVRIVEIDYGNSYDYYDDYFENKLCDFRNELIELRSEENKERDELIKSFRESIKKPYGVNIKSYFKN